MSRSRYYTGGRKRELPPPPSRHDVRDDHEAALVEYADVARWRTDPFYCTRLDYAADHRAAADAATAHHRGRRRSARKRIEEPLSLDKYLARKIARGEIRMGLAFVAWSLPNGDVRRYHVRDGVLTGYFDLFRSTAGWVQKILNGLPAGPPPVTIPKAAPSEPEPAP